MKLQTLFLCVILFAVPRATGQEHAPTAAQCQADVAVWDDFMLKNEYKDGVIAYLKNGTPNKTDVSKLGWNEVAARRADMGTCVKVDAQNIAKYADAMQFYDSVMADRLFDFLTRHDLWPQFRSEDAKGKR